MEVFKHTSLCQVIDKKQVGRLADIDGNKIFVPTRHVKYLQTTKHSLPRGYIGIWSWHEKYDGSFKQHNLATFEPAMLPIEIIAFEEIVLLSKISIRMSSGKALLCFNVDGDLYHGLLCTVKDIDADGKIKSETLPLFEISSKDFIHVVGEIFYSKLNLDAPKYNVDVKRVGLLPVMKQTVDQSAEAKVQFDRLKDEVAKLEQRRQTLEQEIEFLQSSRDDLTDHSAQTIAPPKFFRPGRTVKPGVNNRDLDDFIDAFEDALGTYDDQIDHFAKYLHTAHDNHIPLMLVGPNGRRIADAFSIALNGSTAATFDCAAVNCLDDLNIISSSPDPIVAVVNPFAPNFIAYLPELLNIEGKFFIALYPFVEDLRLEPRSFFNYFTPVFTELIFDQPDPIKILTSSINSTDHAALFAAFPMAYVNGLSDRFVEKFRGSGRTLDRLKKFLGDDQ